MNNASLVKTKGAFLYLKFMASRKDYINIEDIWSKTDKGRSIFEKELGKIPNRAIQSPLRRDKNPSFTVFCGSSGMWLYKDMSNDDCGNAIQFIMKRYNISYLQALKKINKDIALQPVINKVISKRKEKLNIDWADCRFTDRHKQYFDEYELDENFLNSEMDIYALEKYAINGKIVKIPDKWYQFVYFAKDIKEIKILTLGENVPKEEKWRSYNIPNTYIWRYYKYENSTCNKLFVCKSLKDSAVFCKLGYCSVALQNESAKTLLSNNVDILNKISKEIYMVLGTDEQGKQESIKITQKTGWKWLNTENRLLSWGINDPAEYVKEISLTALGNEIKKQLKKKSGKAS